MIPTELSKLCLERDFKGHLLLFNLKVPVDSWKSKLRSALSREKRDRPPLWQALYFHKYVWFG